MAKTRVFGKAKWPKLYLSADEDVIGRFQMLLDHDTVSNCIINTLARFVCKAYLSSNINITCIPELRWTMFCKSMAKSENISLHLALCMWQHVNRVHVQTRTWRQAINAKIPLHYAGNKYHKYKYGQAFDCPPAPTAIVEMAKCQCKEIVLW